MSLPTPETPAALAAPIEITESNAGTVAVPVAVTALAVGTIPIPGA
jgi:hypothetical protein